MNNNTLNFWMIPGLKNEHTYITDLNYAIKIINKSKEIFGLDILKNTRKREFADIRMITAHIIKNHTKLSLKEIGKILGKDHASVVHYCKTTEILLKNNSQFKEKYRQLANENPITIADTKTE